MTKQVTDIVAYLSWPGLLVSFLIGDRAGSRFHLNQSLVIWLSITLLGIVTHWMPLIGWTLIGWTLIGWIVRIVGMLFCAACWFIGFVNAIQGVEKEVPLLGQIHLL